jgi:rhomboid protease GluP
VAKYPSPDQDRYLNSTAEPYLPETNQPSEYSQSVPVSIPRLTPFVTYGLIAITILIYGLQYASQTITGVDYPAFYGAKINLLILEGQFWRFITPTLLHGSVLHLSLIHI